MIALFDLILSIIVLIVFFGMFIRLGQIRDILKASGDDRGVIKRPEEAGSEARSEYEKYNPRWGKK